MQYLCSQTLPVKSESCDKWGSKEKVVQVKFIDYFCVT